MGETLCGSDIAKSVYGKRDLNSWFVFTIK